MIKTKILIVDDRESNLIALEKILRVFDVEIVRALSGNEALQKLIEHKFALVLLDVQMPEMDGFEVVNIMREDSSLEGTPVIFVSAIYRDEIHNIKGIESGAVDFIVKPIIPAILIGKVRIFLNLYEDRERLSTLNKNLQKELIKKKSLAGIANKLILPKFDIDDIAQEILDISRMLTNSKEGFITKIDNKSTLACYQVKTNKFTSSVSSSEINSYLLKLKEEIVLDNYKKDSALSNLPISDTAYSNIIIVPVIYNKIVVGQISVSDSDNIYDNSDIEILHKIATLYALAINRLKEEEIHKKIEENNRQADKMQVLGQLVGGIAHDFNNVLCGIMSASQLLKSPLRQLDEQSKRYVDMILTSSHRASDLVKKLLTFGQRSILNFKQVDMHTLIDSTLSHLKKSNNYNIEIIQKRCLEGVIVNGDMDELTIILDNIFNNAFQAMEHGGTLEIETKIVSIDSNYCDNSVFKLIPGDYFSLITKDSGEGITQENITKVFEPFFTTKDQGKGSGLGLAVVYGAVEIHKGAINVKSTIGVGTSFELLLPSALNITSLNNRN